MGLVNCSVVSFIQVKLLAKKNFLVVWFIPRGVCLRNMFENKIINAQMHAIETNS